MTRPILVLACLLALAAAPAAHAQTPKSSCGVELAQGLALTPGGPICGTDEGDDVDLAGEDRAIGLFGENGHDTVEGSRYSDTFIGGPGNDELHGGRGNDTIDGGDDTDLIFGGLGNDVVRERRFGFDKIYGGPGDDVLAGGRANDELYGGTGNDTLFGGSGSDKLYGGPGDDTLYGGPNRDTFECGPGNDTVYRVSRSTGRFSTGRADPRPPREAGCERIVNVDPTANFPLNQVVGRSGRDRLDGTDQADLIEGKGGGDEIVAHGGDDELEGDGASNQGPDTLVGGAGDDRLAGRAGNDVIYGDARSPNSGPEGRDELVGGSGRDELVGGPGNDLVVGAYDGDTVLAGTGHDVIQLLGGDTSDPNKRVSVDCGRGFDTVVVNPDRRGSFRNCESFVEQFHEADFARAFRPSPESFPPGLDPRAAGDIGVAASGNKKARAAQAPPAQPAVAEPDGGASAPSISGDGARVAFSSDSANLVSFDDNAERTDPFVRDLNSSETILADRRANGRPAIRGARYRRGPGGAISADGRYVAFTSNSQDLAGRVEAYSVFRRDLAQNRTQKACRSGDEDSGNPAISPDGRYIVFESLATNLQPDGNRQSDIYWCDMDTGEVRRVSTPREDDVDRVGGSYDPSVSAGGRFVVFTSDAGGLVPGDGERAGVYLKDMSTGEMFLVDVPAGQTTSNGNGQNPAISADGSFVIFDSDATDLPGGELNGQTIDVFRKDVRDGSIVVLSQAQDGSGGNGDSTADSVSADGRVAAFTSNASNLVLGDNNGRADVFARDIASGARAKVSTRGDGGELDGPSTSGAVSADGRFVAFSSRATNVVEGRLPSVRPRIYRRDFQGGVSAVSVGLDLPPASLIGEPFGTQLRRKVRLISGTARDNLRVARVDVALSRQAGRRCDWLGRGKRLVRRPCSQPLYLPARLVSNIRFTLRLGRLLPRGTWTLRSRAVDPAGQAERLRTGRNLMRFTLR